MMKKLWIVPIFATGLVTGWLIHTNDQTGQKLEIPAPATTKSKRVREITQTNTVDGIPWENISGRWDNITKEERSGLLRNLSSEERASAIKGLFADAGPYGLGWMGINRLDELLKSWVEEDFDSAWAWSQRAETVAMRRSSMSSLLSTLVEIDPERALKLHLEQAELDPAFSSAVPGRLINTKPREGARAMVDFIARLPFNGPSSGRDFLFPKNFDFRVLADGVADLMKARGNKAPPEFPTNFFKEWGKNNPDAAYEWITTNPPLPFSGLENLLDAVGNPERGITPGAWLAGKLETQDEAHDKIIDLLANDRFTTQVPTIAAAMPDIAAADRFLNEVLAKDEYAYSKDRQGLVISALASPEARIAALKRKKVTHNLHFSEIGSEQMQAWGFTEQQINQIFPLGK